MSNFRLFAVCLTLSAIGPIATGPASANDVRAQSIFGAPINPHISYSPQPISDAARARAEDRDRRWMERCRPVIRQDEHGVERYTYAAAGCEFGRIE
jgi:hypothetical protein